MAHEVFLVPGFLGYVKFGGFRYFDDSAHTALRAALDAKGMRDAHITELPTDPTGSLYDRQQLLLDALGERARGADDIHLVGHSTGGVDCWLLLRRRPLGGIAWNDRHGVRARIRSITTISAPFWGSFLAERIADFGPSLARKIPVEEPAPLAGNARLHGAALPARRVARPRNDLLDLLLGAFHSPLTLGFLTRVALNHRLLEDLRPQRMFEVQGAFERDLPNVAFSYFVTVASPPAAPNSVLGYLDAPQFRLAYGLTGDTRGAGLPTDAASHNLVGVPWLEGRKAQGQRPALTRAANDGVVNSLLQVMPRRPPVAFVHGDHADVLGHFHRDEPRRSGELDSRSGFDEHALDTLYAGVVENILAGVAARASAAEPYVQPE